MLLQQHSGTKWCIGIDEVGRGSLIDTVVVCACILPNIFYNPDRRKTLIQV
jgi:ribonuclease HII